MPGCVQLAASKPEGLLTPEATIDHFLCRALRGEPEPWEALPPDADPNLVLLRCRHHGIASLLHHAVAGSRGNEKWPEELLTALRDDSREQVALEMLRGDHLRKLLDRLAEHRIRCLVIKGEALARTLYRTPGTRARGDSDLFISIADIEGVMQAVRDCGFEIVSPQYKTHQFSVRGTGADANVFEIDVHWRILNSPRFARKIGFDEAWRRSVGLPGLVPARTLNAVDALLLSCMHRSASDWHDHNRLIWLYDLHLLWSSLTPQQGEEFAERAVDLDVQVDCLDALGAAGHCFGTQIPEPLAAILAMPAPSASRSARMGKSYAALLADDLKSLPDWRARRGLLAELMRPESRYLLRKYGKQGRAWVPLLYVRHVLGGITRHLTPR